MAYRPIESLQFLLSFVTLGKTPEGLHLEFKREVVWQKTKEGKPTEPRELCRDIAQFANTEGGTILIGVIETKVGDLRVASSIHSVDNPDGLTAWIEDAITRYLVPNTFSKAIVPIQHPDGIVVAVNIPPSVHLVGVWNQHEKKQGIEYLYRTNRGKEWMNPDMVERHLMDGSRAVRLRLKEIFETERGPRAQLEIVPHPFREERILDEDGDGNEYSVWATKVTTALRLVKVGEHSFDISVAGLSLSVPYVFVEAAWVTADTRPAIALNKQIVLDGDNLLLRNV